MTELQRFYEITKEWRIREFQHNNGLEIIYPDKNQNEKRIYIGVSLVGETSFSLIGDSYTGERICKDIALYDDVKEEFEGIISNVIKNSKVKVSEEELNEVREEKINYWINTLLNIGTTKILFINDRLVSISTLKIDSTTGRRTVIGGYLEVNRITKTIEIKLNGGFETSIFNADKLESLEKMEDQLDDYIGLYELLINISKMYFK